jgi:hypothetical protein
MKWLGLFRRGKSDSGADSLRGLLLDAAREGDEESLGRMCRDERDRILANFRTWQKVPKKLQADPNAIDRYARGMIAVADWFARNGSRQLREALQGAGGDNPIMRWQERFGESDRLKASGHFAEAIGILEEIAKEMSSYKGSAVSKYLPMVRGSLGECFFRTGQIDRAYEVTRGALDGCLRSGDIEGVIVYCGNLAEICGKRGEVDEAKYWLIVSTNGMIQNGQEERAAQVRRRHGLEPIRGLIETKEPFQSPEVERGR